MNNQDSNSNDPQKSVTNFKDDSVSGQTIKGGESESLDIHHEDATSELLTGDNAIMINPVADNPSIVEDAKIPPGDGVIYNSDGTVV